MFNLKAASLNTSFTQNTAAYTSLPAANNPVFNTSVFTAQYSSLPKYDLSNVSLANFNRKETIFNKNNYKYSLSNYNASKGVMLARQAARNAGPSSTGYCARGVKEAISETGLGAYRTGHAYDMANILKNNPNFKEISVLGNDLKNLPAGSIIIYNPGDAGYSRKYGHVEIALGDGRAASDYINGEIRDSQQARVFIPV